LLLIGSGVLVWRSLETGTGHSPSGAIGAWSTSKLRGRTDGARRLCPSCSPGVLIIAPDCFSLDNLGVAHAADYLPYSRASLIAIGLVKLWDSREGYGAALAGS
jgi:hypothetical protein